MRGCVIRDAVFIFVGHVLCFVDVRWSRRKRLTGAARSTTSTCAASSSTLTTVQSTNTNLHAQTFISKCPNLHVVFKMPKVLCRFLRFWLAVIFWFQQYFDWFADVYDDLFSPQTSLLTQRARATRSALPITRSTPTVRPRSWRSTATIVSASSQSATSPPARSFSLTTGD